MFDYLRKGITTKTFKESLIVFGGVSVNGALGAVFYILAARFLGPSDFGLLSIAITVLMLATSIGDLGTNTGIVRFVGEYIKNDRTKAYQILKLSFKVKLLLSAIILVLGYAGSGLLAGFVFRKSELEPLFKIAFVGVVGLLTFGFVTSVLRAFQQFWKWSGIQIATNLLRVVVVLALTYFGAFNLNSGLWAYALLPLFGALLALVLLLPREFLLVKGEGEFMKSFFKYNQWVALFTLVGALSSRLDTFLSARFLSTTEVGLYSAGNQLVFIVPQIVNAMGTVISPKMASMKSSDFVPYLKKTQLMVLGLAFLGVLAAPVVAYFIPILYGRDYLGTIPLFLILLAAMLVFLISVPLHNAILYYYSYPKFFFWLSLTHLAFVLLIGVALIPEYGAMGAAVTVLGGQLINLFIPMFWVLNKIKTGNTKKP